MNTPTVQNPFRGSDLDVVEVTDRARIQFNVDSVADQINSARQAGATASKGSPNTSSNVKDLNQYIVDIIFETTVQGASFLEVHIVDPAWTLLHRDQNGNCFIDVDDQGYLWPPIDVNFPPKIADSKWRLCQVRPSTDLNAPNMILVFEDKIAAQLREHQGPLGSTSTQTRAEFIQFLIQTANSQPSPGDDKIRFVHLLPHSTFEAQDLSLSADTPTSAKPPNKRSNPNKEAAALAAFHQEEANSLGTFEKPVHDIVISIEQGIAAIAQNVNPLGIGNPFGTPNSTLPHPTPLSTLGGS